MTPLSTIRAAVATDLELIDALTARQLTSSNPLVNEVTARYMAHKGKQLRPIMVILTAKALAEAYDQERMIASAAAVEMLHNASLIHDDVIDESATRHGHPTLNNVWNNHIAVLTGDYFVSAALQLAISTADLRAVSTIASLGRLLSTGELDQIHQAATHTITEEDYFCIIDHKTASLFVACVEMGAYAAGASGHNLEVMREFARIFGRCFQIQDDIFDYISTADTLGKPVGNDLREGKVTLPLIHALGCTSHPRCGEMNALIERGSLSDSEIDMLIAFAVETGGIEYARGKLREMRSQARDVAGHLQGAAPQAVEPLLALLDYIVERDN